MRQPAAIVTFPSDAESVPRVLKAAGVAVLGVPRQDAGDPRLAHGVLGHVEAGVDG